MGNFSKVFIDRPVLAMVISIVIVLAGSISALVLPVESMPDITPPTVSVSTSYPGANATVLEETVAAPIEQQVNGVEGMLYMSSISSAAGSYNLTVTFEVGTDVDMATVLTQNRVAIAEPLLPEEVKRQGVTVKKKSTNMVMMVALSSPDGRFDDIYLSNYATTQLKDLLGRVAGVGEVQIFGAKDFGMRVWLDPGRLRARQLTADDVVAALREQNVQVAAGTIGQPPIEEGQNFQYTITTLGRLNQVSQFENIIVRRGADGQLVRVRDVARVELGAQAYTWYAELDGQPASLLGIYQIPGANALSVKEGRPLRFHGVHLRLHRRGHHHPDPGCPPGDPHGVHLPSVLPDHPHPVHHHPGLPHRDLRGHAGLRVLHQQPDPLRIGAGHRDRGGRRHRGGGKHHEAHGHGGIEGQGGHGQGHG